MHVALRHHAGIDEVVQHGPLSVNAEPNQATDYTALDRALDDPKPQRGEELR
jgi:hypothetical protein